MGERRCRGQLHEAALFPFKSFAPSLLLPPYFSLLTFVPPTHTCSMFVIKPEDDEEELRATVMDDMADIFSKVDKGGEGVCVQVRERRDGGWDQKMGAWRIRMKRLTR